MKQFKKIWLFILLFPLMGLAQLGGGNNITNPLHWHIHSEKTGADTYNLIFEADIDDGWHLYSQFNDPMGSLPIEFEWKDAKDEKHPNGKYTVIGKAKEFNTHKAFTKAFNVTETFFSKHAKLVQPIKVLDKKLKKIDVTLYGQTCKDGCIQVEKHFTFDLSKAKNLASTVKKQGDKKAGAKKDAKKNAQKDTKKNDTKSSAGKDETSTNDANKTVDNKSDNKNSVADTKPATDHKDDITEGGKYTPIPIAKNQNAEVNEAKDGVEEPVKKKSDWSIFWTAFIAGLLVLLTPCVFPMIPLTISFFTKQSEKSSSGKRNALIYALSIVLIYVAFSLPFHLMERVDSSMFNSMATNTGVNIFFFAIFILFALNLFGVEKLDPVRLVPNSWVSSADKQSNKGGIFAGFFMALTLVIVSFSCTGPALGFILGNAASGASGATTFTFAMLGFGLGIAIPFGILAFFPVLLNQLPQSGAWLNSVKVIFGFIELAFAFKFLSNADLVNQWHFLHREIFIAIWIAITLTMAMYLFGKIRLPHDAPVEHISVFRFLFGISTLTFALYLLPGLWGAPLNIISGFPPPMKYAESKFGVGNTQKQQVVKQNGKEIVLPEGAEFGPNNIIIFEDYDLAMNYAKEVNKPLMIDFTGRACQNCRLMEENVWSKEQILPILNNDVVLVSLFVDERTKLPEDQQYISKYTGDKVTSVGKKWSEMETFVYKNNSQPLYVIVDHDENRMNEPVGYTPEVETYKAWLQKGIDKFKAQQKK